MKTRLVTKIVDEINRVHGIKFIGEIGPKVFNENRDTYLYRGRILSATGAGVYREVVIKILLSDNSDLIQRFEAEAALYARFQHANLIHIEQTHGKNFGRAIGFRRYIIMEYVNGESVSDILMAYGSSQKQLPPSFGLAVVCGVLKALTYVATLKDAQGQMLELIHGDINPRNIMVSIAGEVKLIDFGVAQNKAAQSKNLMGSYPYLAPEQVLGDPVDQRTDLYALSLVLAELILTCRLNYQREADKMLEAAKKAEYKVLEEQSQQIAPELLQIIKNGLSKDPRDRLGSPAQMLSVLEDYAIHNSLVAKTSQMSDVVEYTRWYFSNNTTQVGGDKKTDQTKQSQQKENEGQQAAQAQHKKKNMLSWTAPVFAVLLAVIVWAVWQTANNAPAPQPKKTVLENTPQDIHKPAKDKPADIVTPVEPTVQTQGPQLSTQVDKPEQTKPLDQTKPEPYVKKPVVTTNVFFGSDYWATVSVSGVFSGKEVPVTQKVPIGRRQVVYKWQDDKGKYRTVQTTLQISEGKSYRCVGYVTQTPRVVCE